MKTRELSMREKQDILNLRKKRKKTDNKTDWNILKNKESVTSLTTYHKMRRCTPISSKSQKARYIKVFAGKIQKR